MIFCAEFLSKFAKMFVHFALKPYFALANSVFIHFALASLLILRQFYYIFR